MGDTTGTRCASGDGAGAAGADCQPDGPSLAAGPAGAAYGADGAPAHGPWPGLPAGGPAAMRIVRPPSVTSSSPMPLFCTSWMRRLISLRSIALPFDSPASVIGGTGAELERRRRGGRVLIMGESAPRTSSRLP